MEETSALSVVFVRFVLTERGQLETDLKKAIKEYEEESSAIKVRLEPTTTLIKCVSLG